MTQTNYNWKIINTCSVPVAFIGGIISYNMTSRWMMWILAIVCGAVAGGMTLRFDKRKSSVFTAAAIGILGVVVGIALRRVNIF